MMTPEKMYEEARAHLDVMVQTLKESGHERPALAGACYAAIMLEIARQRLVNDAEYTEALTTIEQATEFASEAFKYSLHVPG